MAVIAVDERYSFRIPSATVAMPYSAAEAWRIDPDGRSPLYRGEEVDRSREGLTEWHWRTKGAVQAGVRSPDLFRRRHRSANRRSSSCPWTCSATPLIDSTPATSMV